MDSKLAVTIWNEFRHEKQDENIRSVYPEGIHEALATPLREAGFQVRNATLDEPTHGLTDTALLQRKYNNKWQKRR